MIERFFRPGAKNRDFFSNKYEKFSPGGTTVQGYVLPRGQVMIDTQVGFLENDRAIKVHFEVDSGSRATILMPKDAKHLSRTGILARNDYLRTVDGTRLEGGWIDTEVWFSGKHSRRDILLAIPLRVFILDVGGGFSLLGRDALSFFKKIQISIADGEVIAKTRESDKVKAYKKII